MDFQELRIWVIGPSRFFLAIPRVVAEADYACVAKVGKKTVEQQVMLVENSYFPIILGR